MTNYEAVMIAEGCEPSDQDTQLEAWQHLINTGLAWQLQGCFGRQAQALIDAGYCQQGV